MTWLLVIGLALAAFLIAGLILRAPRQSWTTLIAALALGLAGYASQARPNLSGAPTQARKMDPQLGWALIEARQAMVGNSARSGNPKVITADAFARNGQYANAVALLRGAVADNPRDAEAWLALGNALVEHADGALTAPALYAYRKAETANPNSAGPGYFIGLAMIRQGRMDEAGTIWRETLASTAADAPGRDQLAMLADRLGGAIDRAAKPADKPPARP
jgi:cytochrome c-type biogenesis protein CcmH